MATLTDAPSPFGFERNFDGAGFHRWFRTVWGWGFVLSAAYVVLVFGGRRLMRDREPFRLRLPLVLWNVGLAVFSGLGAVRFNQAEVFHLLPKHGFVFAVCDVGFVTNPVSGFWTAAFILSKAVEFGDTAFIVLRKQPLIFLHWYHHIVTCLYCWYAYSYLVAPSRYSMAVNYTIHAVMYSYYAVRASGVRLPKSLSVGVTFLQTLQMGGGLIVGVVADRAVQSGRPCSWPDLASYLWHVMYLSYLLLFINFFAKSYLVKTTRSKKE